jgi:hypothetical protein
MPPLRVQWWQGWVDLAPLHGNSAGRPLAGCYSRTVSSSPAVASWSPSGLNPGALAVGVVGHRPAVVSYMGSRVGAGRSSRLGHQNRRPMSIASAGTRTDRTGKASSSTPSDTRTPS